MVPCALCAGRRFSVVHRACPDSRGRHPGRFDVVRCADCGLVQTNPRPDPDAIGAYYAADYGPHARPADAGPPGLALRLARSLLHLPYRLRYGPVDPRPALPRAGARVLDIGCGSGRDLAELAVRGWEVWGIEPSPQAAEAARQHLGVGAERIHVGRAEEARFEPASFDLVTAWHVLEHLHDPAAVLRGARAWLRPGGTLQLAVPDVESLESRLFGRRWFGLDLPRHLYHFAPATLGALLERSGFRVLRIVPEYQANSLSGSVARRPYRPSRVRDQAVLPLAALALGLGSGGAMVATAQPR
jgi:SAM-dependent methyltransferase